MHVVVTVVLSVVGDVEGVLVSVFVVVVLERAVWECSYVSW